MDLQNKPDAELMEEIEELLAVRAVDVDVPAIERRLAVLDARDPVLGDYDVDAEWQRFLRRLESGREPVSRRHAGGNRVRENLLIHYKPQRIVLTIQYAGG